MDQIHNNFFILKLILPILAKPNSELIRIFNAPYWNLTNSFNF